ncbi:MAG: carnitine dehydratase [Robiginitomaculum sp.]|nr:MAG: carnitine dehydratase [Robiginitomaculum sp.]
MLSVPPDGLPLKGYHVVELMGIGPVPYAGQLLGDMGASVIRFEKAGAYRLPVENRGKTCIPVDLQDENSRKDVLEHISSAHILIEGGRPGVAEKLGLGPADCHRVNPKIVYGRMTGWGQSGPWAHKAGHDINYIGLTGALHAMGWKDNPPCPPLNLVGDYGGGSGFLVMGILAALLEAEKTGRGRVIDAAIIDGTASMMGIVYSLESMNLWTTQREVNLLDGSHPYYRCYATSDGSFIAVGCLEEKFYREMLNILGLNISDFGGQNDSGLWPEQIKILTDIFVACSRKYWEDLFEHSDACVTPVLTYEEATYHPQNKARKSYYIRDGITHPIASPRFI